LKPACPLATVLYRFDDAARFPIFESHTTAKGQVAVQTERDDAGSFLRIAYQWKEDDADEVTIVLALPIVAVDGRPRQLLLDVLGEADGSHLHLEYTDGRGGQLVLPMGNVDFKGWRTLRINVSKFVSPLQFHRLRITSDRSTSTVQIGLRALTLTGSVRVVPAGIA